MSEAAEGVVRPWAPSIGLGVGLLVIGWGGWLSVRESPTSAGVLFAMTVTVGLVLPAFERWPLSRRRCAVTAAAWLVLGLASWVLFWVLGPVFALYVAPLAAMPALIGCGVGLD